MKPCTIWWRNPRSKCCRSRRPRRCPAWLRGIAQVSLSFALAMPAAAQVTYTWTGGSGDWTDSSEWTPSGVPGAIDTAVINAGSPTLATSASVAGLTFEAGGLTLTGSGDLSVTGAMTWSGGDLLGAGTLRVETGATLLLDGAAHSIAGSFVNAGLAIWQAGELDGAGQFINEGELVLAPDVVAPTRLCFASPPGFITNASSGLIRRTGSGEITIYCPFDNAGTVRVETGSLALRGFNATGGSDSGDYEVETAGTLILDGGAPRTMSAEASISGQGTLAVHGGNTGLAGAYDMHATRFMNVNGSGVLNLNADATTDTLEIVTGTLGGSGTLTVTEAFTWTGGGMGGSGTTVVGPTATLAIDGADTKYLSDSRILQNDGAGIWAGSDGFSNGGGALFLNNGTLEVVTGTPDAFGTFFAGTFTNTGTFILDSGDITRFASFFHNQGVVEIVSGTLTLSGSNADGGTHSGSCSISEGAALEFAGGNHTLTDAALIHGNGVVAHSNGGLANHASIAPGASPGILTWMSAPPFAPQGDALLDIEIGGYAPGAEHDVLAVDGRALPAGTIEVSLTDGFLPDEGEEITILTATEGVCREFDTEILPPGYRLVYYPTEVRFRSGPPDDRLFVNGFEADPCAN